MLELIVQKFDWPNTSKLTNCNFKKKYWKASSEKHDNVGDLKGIIVIRLNYTILIAYHLLLYFKSCSFYLFKNLPGNFHLHIQNKVKGISKHYPIQQHTPGTKQKSQMGCSIDLGQVCYPLSIEIHKDE